MIEIEIKAQARIEHDLLTKLYYHPSENLPFEDRITKEEFDFRHGKIWTDMEAELLAEGFIKPPEPSELDKLKDRVKALEDRP